MLVLAGILLLCAAAYLPALRGELVSDDIPLLLGNDCWRGLDKVPAMFGLGEPNPCTYRPVRYLTYALDYTIGGSSPLVFHLSNLVYHLLAAVAVFFLLRRWASAGAAVLIMGLWALHPVQTDAVAYIAGRRDVVSTLLFVVAFLQLSPPAGKSLGWGRTLLGLALFLLAIGTNEMAVTLPAVLVWAAIAGRVGRLGELKDHFKRFWSLYALLFAGAVAFVVYRVVLDPHSQMLGQWWGGNPVSNFATVFALYVHYFELVLWPAELIGDYYPFTIPLADSFADPRALFGVFLYLVLLALIVFAFRRGWRAVAFGLGWFLITMLPVSHIFPHHEMFAEHHLYLPLIGLAAAGLEVVEKALAAPVMQRRVILGLVALVLVAYGGRTWVRAGEFRSRVTFYQAAFNRATNNARVAYNLGLAYLEDGQCDRAVPLMLGVASYIRRDSPMSRVNLIRFIDCGRVLGRSELVDTLLGELVRRYPRDPLGLTWLGQRQLRAGQYRGAVDSLMRAVEHEEGRDADTVAMLALALSRAGRPEEALDVLETYPSEHQGHCEQQVQALLALGVEHYSQAFRHVQECLRTYPDSLLLLEFRAGLYFSAGQPEAAEADIARMEELGASEEALGRVRAWRSLR